MTVVFGENFSRSEINFIEGVVAEISGEKND